MTTTPDYAASIGRRFISNKRRADMCPACAKAVARDATKRTDDR